MPVDVSELSTFVTPSPLVSAWISSAYAVRRVSSASHTPRSRSRARLRGPPAVPTTCAPSVRSTSSAASPTPPDVACTSTRDSGVASVARDSAMSTVTNTVGVVAAAENAITSGLRAAAYTDVRACEPRQPGARPSSDSPAWNARGASGDTDTATPAQSAPGGPGSPGYMPSTFSTSRKLTPTATTRSVMASARSDTPSASSACALRPVKAPRGIGSSWKRRTVSCACACSSLGRSSAPARAAAPCASPRSAFVVVGAVAPALASTSTPPHCTCGNSAAAVRSTPHADASATPGHVRAVPAAALTAAGACAPRVTSSKRRTRSMLAHCASSSMRTDALSTRQSAEVRRCEIPTTSVAIGVPDAFLG